MKTKMYNRILKTFSTRFQHRQLTVVKIFLIGLVAAQFVSTMHVWYSNQNLHAKLQALTTAGYFTIPTQLVHPPIDSMTAAFWGGLFFTLTVGSGMTLFTFAATFIWGLVKRYTIYGTKLPSNADHSNAKLCPKLFRPIKIDGFFLIIIVIYILFNLNKNGICVMANLYLLVIPVIVAVLTYRWVMELNLDNLLRRIYIVLSPILVLTVIWGSQWDENLFIRIRDNLLFESTFGRTINDFYYRYTLYPAEAFKSLSQKMLKTYYFDGLEDAKLTESIETRLRYEDYLAVADSNTADLVIDLQSSEIIFSPQTTSQMKFKFQEFISNPKDTLEKVSQNADTNAFFRQLIFFSLLFGFPVTLYVLLFGILQWFMGLFTQPLLAAALSSLLCLLVGLTIFYPVWQAKTPQKARIDLGLALTAERWQTRVAALQSVAQQHQKLTRTIQYEKSLKSPHISERYWLARALANSKSHKTYLDLLRLLADPHPNVRCQAFYGLGNRNQYAAIQPIFQAIKSTDHWYVQWYGYNALRRLGWVQPRSKLRRF